MLTFQLSSNKIALILIIYILATLLKWLQRGWNVQHAIGQFRVHWIMHGRDYKSQIRSTNISVPPMNNLILKKARNIGQNTKSLQFSAVFRHRHGTLLQTHLWKCNFRNGFPSTIVEKLFTQQTVRWSLQHGVRMSHFSNEFYRSCISKKDANSSVYGKYNSHD